MPCTDARCKRVSPLWRLTMLLWFSASECYTWYTLHSCSIRFSPVFMFLLFVQQEAGIHRCRCDLSKSDGYVCRLGATGRTIRLATECLDLCCVCVGLHGFPTSFLSLSPSLLYPFAGVEQPIIHGQHLQAIRLNRRESTNILESWYQ